jgi:hypothetical protein
MIESVVRTVRVAECTGAGHTHTHARARVCDFTIDLERKLGRPKSRRRARLGRDSSNKRWIHVAEETVQ